MKTTTQIIILGIIGFILLQLTFFKIINYNIGYFGGLLIAMVVVYIAWVANNKK
jgi:uncharacterized membrane protein